MKAEEFSEHALIVASKFRWIKRIESKVFRNRVRVRLWLNNSFVDVYYNSEEEIASYAYVEEGRRLFGANNMRIGWHLHPFGEVERHVPTKPVTIEEFLKMLEKELRKRGKI